MAVALAGTTLLGAGLWHKHHRISPAPSKQVTKNADALPTGVSEATLADIRSSLEKQEYHVSFDDQKKKLQSPNRRNNIRAYYEPGKLTVQTRVDTTGEGFKMELVNEGIFADSELLYTPEMAAKAEHHENKVQISHSAFTEEFVNNEDGVRQNFIVENAPEGTRQLQVKMTAKGLKVEQGSGNELRFYSEAADGKTRNELVYSDLKCWDANKKPLNATLAYVDNRIQISVDVAGAAYPVTIDPIIANGTPQNANKVIQIDQSYMHLGFSVSSAGDVNGDGFDDIIVGAPGITNGQNNEGVARVYYGSLNGISSPFNTLIEVNQAEAAFGTSVAGAGDVNGDGYDDVIVGAPYYDDAVANGGGIWIFHGSYNGLNITNSFSLKGEQVEDHFGQAVSGGGDLNGDGYSDIVVGIPGIDQSGMTNNGSVRAYFGNDGYAGKNKRNSTRLYNTNMTPMTYGQSTLSSVVIGIHATSFLGRNNGRLAWDYTQNGTSFSKVPNNPITTSTIIDDAQTSFGTLSGTEVKTAITKLWTATRLRVRFKHELATALTGQVYGPWRTVPEYLLYLPTGSPPVLASEEFERAVVPDVQPKYKDLLSVYPNPTADRLFIQSTNMDQVSSLQLISANGTMAFTSAKPQSEVDVKHLPAGSYVLVINRKDGSKTSHKVLIRK